LTDEQLCGTARVGTTDVTTGRPGEHDRQTVDLYRVAIARHEWLPGPAMPAAPDHSSSAARDIQLPAGTWYDVNRGTTVKGLVTPKAHPTP
jgi:alpha-glucosidase (family GH31 glycosyl hydrolase)